EDRQNVGMVQCGGGARLLCESLQTVPVGGQRSWQYLDCHSPVQPRIMGAIHFAHSACADRRLNFVRAELGARGYGHGWRRLYPQRDNIRTTFNCLVCGGPRRQTVSNGPQVPECSPLML